LFQGVDETLDDVPFLVFLAIVSARLLAVGTRRNHGRGALRLDLGDLAVQLTMSAVISNDSGVGGTNPIRTRNIMPIEEARLANGLVDPVSKSTLAGSLTTWYLVSAEGKTIEFDVKSEEGDLHFVPKTDFDDFRMLPSECEA